MDRRSFLIGTFGGVVATGVVVTASAAEVSRFAVGIPDGAPLVLPSPRLEFGRVPELGEALFDYMGNQVAIVYGVEVRVAPNESTSPDGFRMFTPGLLSFTLTATGSWRGVANPTGTRKQRKGRLRA